MGREDASGAETLAEFLREETTGGRLLLAASAVALVWANLAEGSYTSFWATEVSIAPTWLHLDLTLEAWAADGLLAIFFFVAGLELKRELVVGELANRRAAALPVFAAVGGIIMPALIAILVSGGEALDGGAWAVPVATDIAFALGVLALVGAALPSGVRIVLLSIAVVDDLLAIALIAVIFTSGLDAAWLAAAAASLGAYRLAFRLGKDWIWLLWVLGIGVWICVHASGVHATVAGIALALLTPVRPRQGEANSPASRFEHRLHPVSAGFAVPVFALAAAGVSLSALGDAATDQLAIAIFLGLLVGKFVGILAGAGLAVRLRLGALPAGVGWADVVPVAVLGGIGYTVSLLISQLAFDQAGAEERAAASVLAASVVASLVALVLLRRRAADATSEGGRDPF